MTTPKFNHIYIYSVRSLFHNHETITHTGFVLTENLFISNDEALDAIRERLHQDGLVLSHIEDLKDQSFVVREYTDDILARIDINDFTGLCVGSYWFDTETFKDNCILTYGISDSHSNCTQDGLWGMSLQLVGKFLPKIYTEERSEETFVFFEATQYTEDAVLRMLMEKKYEPA